MSDKDAALVECHGGPCDGRRIVARGALFPVASALNPDGTIRPFGRPSGHYVRVDRKKYQWRPALGEAGRP